MWFIYQACVSKASEVTLQHHLYNKYVFFFYMIFILLIRCIRTYIYSHRQIAISAYTYIREYMLFRVLVPFVAATEFQIELFWFMYLGVIPRRVFQLLKDTKMFWALQTFRFTLYHERNGLSLSIYLLKYWYICRGWLRTCTFRELLFPRNVKYHYEFGLQINLTLLLY